MFITLHLTILEKYWKYIFSNPSGLFGVADRPNIIFEFKECYNISEKDYAPEMWHSSMTIISYSDKMLLFFSIDNVYIIPIVMKSVINLIFKLLKSIFVFLS